MRLPDAGGALGRLVAGFDRFRQHHFEADHDLYDRLLDGQQPEVMVVACSDSRTDPAIICGARPGELFVVRNVAALVPPPVADGAPHGTASAIEFGVKVLGVKHVVVLGHSFCAGVRCLLDHGEVREEMDGLVTEAERALVARRAEQAAVLASLRHLPPILSLPSACVPARSASMAGISISVGASCWRQKGRMGLSGSSTRRSARVRRSAHRLEEPQPIAIRSTSQ
jgi:carbonic anhydrase